jgi:hypothetical protein
MNEDDVNNAEAIADTEAPEVEAAEHDDGPETLLEAIQEGLKPEETAKSEEEKPAEEAESEKPEAAENDEEPPEGIGKKAQERFRSMVARVKEKDAEIEHLTRNLGGIRDLMRETGGTPEDFSKSFEYIRAIRRGDIQQARSILEDQIRQISVATGQPFGAVDPLVQHPDLRERVNAFQMDEATALEMARHRAAQQEQQQAAQQFHARQQSEVMQVRSRQQAIAEIDRLGSEWAKSDPDYAAKESVIARQAQLIAQQFPPQQWAAQVRLMYQTLSAMPQTKPASHAPAPLRASGQTAGARQPGSMLEAIQGGLGYGNG